MKVGNKTIRGTFSLLALAPALALLTASGCRSAVDDFYRPLTGAPDSHCGGAGDAGAGGGTSTGSAAGGMANTGGSAGNAQTGGTSSGCSTGGGGGGGGE